MATPISNMTVTWNNAGTTFNAIKMNVTDTASNAASLLMDLQTGGTSRINASKAGALRVTNGTAAAPAISSVAATNVGFNFPSQFAIDFVTGGGVQATVDQGNPSFTVGAQLSVAWGSSGVASPDVHIRRDNAANTLALRNATNAQTFNVYNTYTTTTNYERGFVSWLSNTFCVGTEKGSGGGTARSLQFRTDGVGRWLMDTNGHFTAVTDSTYDIGASGANRPRDIFAARDVYAQSNTAGFYLGTSSDVALLWDAANTLAMRRSTNAQTFNIYNTYSTTTNYERGFLKWNTNVLQIGTEKGSGGGTGRDLAFYTDGALRLTIDATGGVSYSAVQVSFNSQVNLVNNRGYAGSGLINSANLLIASNSTKSLELFSDATSGRGIIIATSTGIVQFAGTTSSFPALKRNSTALETKLADDSAYAAHAMQYLDVTDGVTAPASATGRARIYVDTADGDLKVIFGDGTVKTIVTDT